MDSSNNIKNMLNDIRLRLKDILQTENTTINRISSGNPAIQRKLQRQLNEDAMLSVDTLLYFLKVFPGLSSEWIIEGKGQAFPGRTQNGEKHPAIADCVDMPADAVVCHIGTRYAEVIEEDSFIPVYSVEASANLDTLQVGDSSEHIVGTVHVPNVPRCDGATYIRGDSMYPLLQSGDLIGFKRLPVSRESIFFGEIYLVSLDVEGDRYLTVKYIRTSELGADYITLHSANPAHPDKDVHLSSVKMLALVKFTIRMNSMY